MLQYAGTILQDKVMFGTDYPMIEPEEWLADFAEHTDYPPAVQRKLLRENAEELLDL